MWNWFKRKNATPEVDKEKGTSKFNASDVSVEVDGRRVTVAELEAELLEAEEETAEEANHEPISMEEAVTLSNGKEYKVGDLVANWKSRQAKKNADGKKKEEVIGDKEKEEGDADEAELKKNAEAKEAKEKEEADKKNAADAEAKEKEAEEKTKKENAKAAGRASFKEIQNASKNFVDQDARVQGGVKTRSDRAKEWAKRNARKE